MKTTPGVCPDKDPLLRVLYIKLLAMHHDKFAKLIMDRPILSIFLSLWEYIFLSSLILLPASICQAFGHYKYE